MIFNQRDSHWANQRLGTVDGATIGQYGCFVSSYAMVATHFGKDTDPARLDDYFTEHRLYVGGYFTNDGTYIANLCADDMLTKVYPDIVYQGTYNCQSVPCDLNVLNDFNVYEHEAIIEVDFDHDPNDGIQTHFVRMNGYDPVNGTIEIDDPWYGDRVNFADRYGDPTVTIQKVVKYFGPGQTPSPPVESAPVPDPQPVAADPTLPSPGDVVVPLPEATPENQPTQEPTQESPTNTEPATPDVQVPELTITPVGPILQPEPTNVGNTKMQKLKSRKFWVTVGTWIAVLIGALVHYFSSTQTASLMGLITAVYVAVQGQIDKQGQ